MTLRACTQHGCPTLVPKGRCDKHGGDGHGGRKRDPEQQRFYNSAHWQAIRKQVRIEEPTCRLCWERPSQRVDHIDGNWRNNARSNLRALCSPCDYRRTGRQHAAKRG